MRRRFGSLHGLRLTYVGEGNNVARALAIASVLAGIDFRCRLARGLRAERVGPCDRAAAAGPGSVTQTEDPHAALRDASAVYTDVWASMGDEHMLESRLEDFAPFRLDAELLASAPPDALIMHDLPAHRGERSPTR